MPRSTGSRHRVRPECRSGSSRPPTAGAAPSFATSPVYRPRRPAETPLYRVVQHHLNTFLAQAEADEIRPVPRWTEWEFRQYLTCGILAYGFARARCGDCHQERLIAFSCKGRGVCPSCTNRRMAEVAAHPRDQVIPRVPVRQWVLSVPKRLRPALARDPDLAGAVLRILLRVIHRALQETVGVPPRDEMRFGAVSFLHRFGSACPACRGGMRIVSFLTDPPVVRQILEHLDLPVRPPLLAPARGPPQHEFLPVDPPSPFDIPASAPAERDPFDQSLPGDDGTWSA